MSRACAFAGRWSSKYSPVTTSATRHRRPIEHTAGCLTAPPFTLDRCVGQRWLRAGRLNGGAESKSTISACQRRRATARLVHSESGQVRPVAVACADRGRRTRAAPPPAMRARRRTRTRRAGSPPPARRSRAGSRPSRTARSEEHTSELQSRLHLVCRLLLEKKKKTENKS